MAEISIINQSKLENTLRIDSEYYQTKYLALENAIIRTRSYKLWKHIKGKFITGPFGSEFIVENYVENGSFRYVRGRDIKEFFILDDNSVYMSKEDFYRLKKYSLDQGDILISVVGTLGNAAIVDEKTIPAIFSCKSTLYRSESLDPFYIIAYLNSEYGHSFLEKKVRGAVQTGLNIDDLKSTPIFIPGRNSEKNIANIVKKAKNYWDLSKKYYSEAEKLLLKELGFKEYVPIYRLNYLSKVSTTVTANRLDAEYFQPFFDNVEKKLIDKFNAKPLGKYSFIDVTTGQYTENYVDKSEGKPYIRGTDIKYGSISEEDLVYISTDRQIDSKKAKEGDVVVTRVGTIGLSARIQKECDGGTISDNLIRLRFDEKKLRSYYLALFLGSPIGVSLMIRKSRGSVQQRLNQETLKEVVVPILPNNIQKKLTDIVIKSHKARNKAMLLLEEAKKQVENEIERAQK